MIVHGIPVVFNTRCRRIAQARGVFRKRIEIGHEWHMLPALERRAVLYHEAGHCVYRHMEKRWLYAPLVILAWLGVRWAFESVKRLCHAQELEADDFARRNGHGFAMAAMLARHPENETLLYPDNEARIRALKA